MIHIFVSKIPQAFDSQRAAESFKSIFSGEKNTAYLDGILQKKHPSARAQSLFALETLARGLESIGIDAARLTLAKTPSGKPYFQGKELYFSISHDADTVAVAISGQDVGIDIQSSRGASREQEIAQRFFTQNECDSIKSGETDFLSVWTKREAYAKLTDTPLASMLKKELQSGVLFEFFSLEQAKISVATLNPDDVQITVLE